MQRCYAFDILLVDLGPAGEQVAQGSLVRVEDDPVHCRALLGVDLVDVEIVAVEQVSDHCRLVPLRCEEQGRHPCVIGLVDIAAVFD